jgi:hypothetical protein
VRLRIRPSEQIPGYAIAAADSSLVRCRSRAGILVALVTFGVVCHAQMPRPDASDVKSCAAELASCQALLGSFGGKEAKDVVHLAAITPSAKSSGSRFARRRLAFACVDCMITASPCGAEPSALVRKQYPESDATSCAAMLRDCRAHGSARRRQTSGGEPLASRLPSVSTLSRT